MPRIPYPDPEQLTQTQRKTAGSSKLNIGKMTAYLPDDILPQFLAFGTAVLRSQALDPLLRELAIIRVGYLQNSPYEINQHVQFGRQLGLSEDKLEGLKQGAASPAFTEIEKRLLEFVDEIILNVRPSDAALAGIQAHLSTTEIMCVIIAVGQYMTMCRIIETSGVELDLEGVVVNPAQ